MPVLLVSVVFAKMNRYIWQAGFTANYIISSCVASTPHKSIKLYLTKYSLFDAPYQTLWNARFFMTNYHRACECIFLIFAIKLNVYLGFSNCLFVYVKIHVVKIFRFTYFINYILYFLCNWNFKNFSYNLKGFIRKIMESYGFTRLDRTKKLYNLKY